MNIPERVKIGPYVYDVVVHADRLRAFDGNGWSTGQIDDQGGTIRLFAAAPRYMFATFIHECLHGMSNIADTDLTESETTRLGHVLAAWMIDNGYVKESS